MWLELFAVLYLGFGALTGWHAVNSHDDPPGSYAVAGLIFLAGLVAWLPFIVAYYLCLAVGWCVLWEAGATDEDGSPVLPLRGRGPGHE